MLEHRSSSPEGYPAPPGAGKEWAFRVLLVALSLGVFLLLAEGVLRVLRIGAPRPSQPRVTASPGAASPGAASPGAEDAGSGSAFDFFAYHPRLGWDLVPGAIDRHTTDEFDVELRISQQGLRSDRVYEPAEARSTVIALGDSFTFGHGVDVERAWPAQLEARLGLPVPNLAVTGYGTDQQLLRFEAMAAPFRPRAVVLGLFVGNVFRNARDEQIGYPKPRFVLDEGSPHGLRLEPGPVPRSLDAEAPAWRLGALLGARGRDLGEHLGFGEAWPITRGIVERLRDASHDLGAELYVLVLPKDRSVYGGGWRARMHARSLDRLRHLLDEVGVPYLDSTPLLRERAAERPEERLYFAADGHWTPEAHALVAEELAEWLRPRLAEPTPEGDS